MNPRGIVNGVRSTDEGVDDRSSVTAAREGYIRVLTTPKVCVARGGGYIAG